jgi:hypothetical protein
MRQTARMPRATKSGHASALEAYLESVDPRAAPLVRDLDAAIRQAHARFSVAVKYRLLMYALGEDWRHWVCAIDARRSAVSLRFLYGVLLEDPLRVLRPGTSVLMTWDLPLDAGVDAEAVEAYVRDAVARYDQYRANEREVLAASRQAAKSRRARRPPTP